MIARAAATVGLDAFFRRMFEDAPGAITFVDVASPGGGRLVNSAMCALMGYERDTLISADPAALIDDRDRVAHEVELARLIAGEIAHLDLEQRYRHRGGGVLWLRVTAAIMRDASGVPLGAIYHLQDVSQRKRLEAKVVYQAAHDPLTDLLNRRSFLDEVSRCLDHARRYGDGGALAMLDVDRLKIINDVFGHAAGDTALVTAARVMVGRLRATDVVARLGGDEFAILLPHTTVASAVGLINDLKRLLREDTTVSQPNGLPVTMSAGIVMFSDIITPGDLLAEDDLFVSADEAMYAAKAAGGNTTIVYDPAAADVGVPRTASLGWTSRIRKALRDDEFVLYRQPIVDLVNGNGNRQELLLRLPGSNGEPILPEAFMHTAERFGLAAELDHWVIRHALDYQAEHREKTLHINLSAVTISDVQTPRFIANELSQRAVDPRSIVFEVTETTAIANIHSARSFVTQITDLGCAIALDDFGAGYGSFYCLKYFPMNLLKINGEFIRDLANTTDRAFVEAIVAMAHTLDKQTVAEHVQDEQTLKLLADLGVDYAQGFHIAHPTPL